jgi:hypothetical protein
MPLSREMSVPTTGFGFARRCRRTGSDCAVNLGADHVSVRVVDLFKVIDNRCGWKSEVRRPSAVMHLERYTVSVGIDE